MRGSLMGLVVAVALIGVGVAAPPTSRNLFAGAGPGGAPERLWYAGTVAPILITAPAPDYSATWQGGVLDPIVVSAAPAAPAARCVADEGSVTREAAPARSAARLHRRA